MITGILITLFVSLIASAFWAYFIIRSEKLEDKDKIEFP